MRIVYMGTPEFAKTPLEQLIKDGHDIAGVFTQPDKPRNRGMKVSHSPVKELALANNIPVFQPDSLKDASVAEVLDELKAELFAVVAYGKILPADILNLPPLGAVNIHASLLPKYRGAAPIHWAILNGEQETGVSSMYMSPELDAGDVIMTKKTAIGENETTGALYDRLKVLGAQLLSETVLAISQNNAHATAQNHNEATFAPLLSKDLSMIDWSDTAYNIQCKVRGLNPWPVATTMLRGVLYKVFSVEISEKLTSKAPGALVSSGKFGIEIACQDGTVIIKDLQAPGGKRMAASDHIKGNPF
ncbi:MAG: methionyl-tRNA formyltransferase [Oscillospiraceae bacterium]|nr:methionyl-tRNA formyltransferase [Oscillospiraceae bacterium]